MVGDVSAAVASHDADVAVARRENHGRFARDRDVQVTADAAIPGTLRIGVHGDNLSVDANLGTRGFVPFVSLTLRVRIHTFMNGNVNLLIARICNVDGAMLTGDTQAAASRKGLLQFVGVVVVVTTPR